MISGKYLAMIAAIDTLTLTNAIQEKAKAIETGDLPNRRIGYCLCSRRISTNKEQCLALKLEERAK